jgi:hypothetical protein
MGDMNNTCKVLAGKPEGKIKLVDLNIDVKIIFTCVEETT